MKKNIVNNLYTSINQLNDNGPARYLQPKSSHCELVLLKDPHL